MDRTETVASSVSLPSESSHNGDTKATIQHLDVLAPTTSRRAKWKISRKGGGDTALALFDNPDELHEPIDPEEEKKLMRKIDLMILPYLAVCYCFFYVSFLPPKCCL
jgi:hypothetical protein